MTISVGRLWTHPHLNSSHHFPKRSFQSQVWRGLNRDINRTLMSNILFAGAKWICESCWGCPKVEKHHVFGFLRDGLSNKIEQNSSQSNWNIGKPCHMRPLFPDVSLYKFFRFTDYLESSLGNGDHNFWSAPHLEWAHWPNLSFTRCPWLQKKGLPIPSSFSKDALTVVHLQLFLLVLYYPID